MVMKMKAHAFIEQAQKEQAQNEQAQKDLKFDAK